MCPQCTPGQTCRACKTWARKYGDTQIRTNRHWTVQERNYVQYHAGYKTVPQIAKALNRTPSGVYLFMRAHHISVRATTRRREGMGTSEVCAALGVYKNMVLGWVKRGWLPAVKARTAGEWYYSFAHDDVLDFLIARGALWPMEPSIEWRDVYEQARADLLARYISGVAIVEALYSSKGALKYWRTAKGFPAPALETSSRYGGFYYERAAVRSWCAVHKDLVPGILRGAI